MKIFEERGIHAAGNILPYEKTRLFSDIKDPVFDTEKQKDVIARAEQFLNVEIPFWTLAEYRRYAVDGDRAAFERKYFLRRDMALYLALAEHFEGKGRFTAKLCDVIWAIEEETTWVIPAHLYNHTVCEPDGVPPVYDTFRLHGVDLFSAMTGAVMSVVLLYARTALDSVSLKIAKRLDFELEDRIVKPMLNITSFWWMGERGGRVNNWGPWIVSNVLFVTATQVKDLFIREQLAQKSIEILDRFVSFYHDDGGCDEGANYWGAAGGALFDALEVLYDLSGGKIDVFDHPLVKAICTYITKVNINADRFVNFADCPPSVRPDGAMIRRMGEKCGSEALIAFGDEMHHRFPHMDTGRINACLRYLLMKKPEGFTPYAEMRNYLSGLEIMTARETEDTAKGLFLAMKGGNNEESHNHNDVGNFVVYANGNPVLLDTGAGIYTKKTFSAQRYEIFTMRSSYHNLPTFDGVEQKNGVQYAASDVVYDGETGSLSLELKGAYPAEAGIASYRRTAVLAGGQVAVTDSVSLEREEQVDFFFMSCIPSEINGDSVSLAEGKTLHFDSRKLTASVETVTLDDANLERSWNGKCLWRIRLSARTKKDTFVFLVD